MYSAFLINIGRASCVVYNGITFDILRDTEALDRALALSEPLWEPGTAHGYHAVSIGLFASALVRRVDPKNRTLGQFFAEEVADVFGEYYLKG